MVNWLLILFIFSTPSLFSACNAGSGTKILSSAMLELTIQLPEMPVPLNTSLPVKVSLVNKGDTAVLVNTRMSVGYKESLSRELYAALKDLETGSPAKYSPLDINRDFAVSNAYKKLLPGDSVAASFNLLEYYPLKKKGRYELIVSYQADEPLAQPPPDIWEGIVFSRPVQFELLEGKLPVANN